MNIKSIIVVCLVAVAFIFLLNQQSLSIMGVQYKGSTIDVVQENTSWNGIPVTINSIYLGEINSGTNKYYNVCGDSNGYITISNSYVTSGNTLELKSASSGKAGCDSPNYITADFTLPAGEFIFNCSAHTEAGAKSGAFTSICSVNDYTATAKSAGNQQGYKQIDTQSVSQDLKLTQPTKFSVVLNTNKADNTLATADATLIFNPTGSPVVNPVVNPIINPVVVPNISNPNYVAPAPASYTPFGQWVLGIINWFKGLFA